MTYAHHHAFHILTDSNLQTCLHLACLYSMDFDLFHELLQLWPDATKWKDRDGWHPLHLACLCHCPSTIASTVLNAYPEAAAIADTEEEQFPLHIAALHGANGTLLQVRMQFV